MYSIIRKKSSAAAGASGAAFTCGTFHRYDRRLLRASGTPLCRAVPSLSSPAGGTMRHGRRSVPQAASRIPLHRSCSRQRPALLSLAAREKDALPYFPSLGLRSPTVKAQLRASTLLPNSQSAVWVSRTADISLCLAENCPTSPAALPRCPLLEIGDRRDVF